MCCDYSAVMAGFLCGCVEVITSFTHSEKPGHVTVGHGWEAEEIPAGTLEARIFKQAGWR